jgi:hypothetical protein
MIQLPAVQIRKEGRVVSFEVPPPLDSMVSTFIAGLKGWAGITLSRPKRPRTTGPESQNHHFNSHVQDIAVSTGNDFQTVKMAIKEEAIGAGYPFATFRDKIIPQSEADASTTECAILIDTAHRIAAELGIVLREGE